MAEVKECYNCGGIIAFGEPHEMKINDELTFWCLQCIEEYSEAVWPEEDWGPRKPDKVIVSESSKSKN